MLVTTRNFVQVEVGAGVDLIFCTRFTCQGGGEGMLGLRILAGSEVERRLDGEGHGVGAAAEVAKIETGTGAIPPMGAGYGAVGETVAVTSSGVAKVVKVGGITLVHLVLEIPAIVGLYQSEFVISVSGVRGEALVIVIAQLIDVPDGNAGGGKIGVTAGLLPVLDDVILGWHARFSIAVKMVEIGSV